MDPLEENILIDGEFGEELLSESMLLPCFEKQDEQIETAVAAKALPISWLIRGCYHKNL